MRLIDADALKQSVEECDVCNVCPERKARCNYDCEFPDHLTPKFEALIDAQPTIEPKRGEWIPCSERLPEENGRYLVTFPSLINKPWIDILWYGRPTFPETDHPCFYASDDEYGDVEYDDVVAWVPLPKPYEEREDE